jgi:hypothetical protein
VGWCVLEGGLAHYQSHCGSWRANGARLSCAA